MSRQRVRSRGFRVRGLVAAGALFVAGLAGGSSHAAGALSIEVLSNRADLISGGDALVQVDLPAGVSASDVTMKLGATDVTNEFALRPNGKYQGVLTGLALGPNVLKALLPDNSGAQISITNHPSSGPVFAGPQVQPWSCNAGATDAQCNRPVSYSFLFMPVGAGAVDVPHFPPGAAEGDVRLLPYDPANPPPAALIAQTTTDQGKTVPYVVRVETGSVDRGQYKIAVLFDPAKGWAPWAPQEGWNHKLFVTSGAGCGLTYTEGSASTSNSVALSRGFAMLSTTQLVSGHTCHMVEQAESLMMAKEHFIETYGLVRYTFSWGGSGASIFQQQVANAYPGLLDGIIPQVSFQGGWGISRPGYDCGLMLRYWTDPTLWAPGVVWTVPQMGIVAGNGAGVLNACALYSNFADSNFGPAGAPTDAYDAHSNPGGVRADFQDYGVSVMGRRPPEVWTAAEQAIGRGFGNRPLDNVGVAYGLNALKSGIITPAQFIDLNAKVGGRDIDWNWHAQRDEADPAAIATAYHTGLDNEASNLDQVPIIDLEVQAGGKLEIHDAFRAWSMRALLDNAHGTHDNQVIWSDWNSNAFTGYQLPPLNTQAFLLMDRWLSAIEADTSNRSRAEKVIANKPADAVDRCTTGAGLVENDALCNQAWREESPRMAAGGPLADDITKCQLRPLNATDFSSVPFSASQLAHLQQIFPSGVCDYSKPGVAQVPTSSSWLTYQDDGVGGGTPLGAAPVSTAI